MFQYRRDRLRATRSPRPPADRRCKRSSTTRGRERLETLPRFVPFIVVIALIMVALYGGWATPSEVAGIGAAAALLMVVLIYRCYRWSDMRAILGGTVRESCMVMLIIAMSFLYTYVMSYLHVTQSVAEWLIALPLDKWTFFFWVNVLLIVLGFFLPPVAIILMVTPITAAGAEGARLRPHLVRRDHDDPDGDGADPPSGRAQSLRHQRHRARHSAAGRSSGACCRSWR